MYLYAHIYKHILWIFDIEQSHIDSAGDWNRALPSVSHVIYHITHSALWLSDSRRPIRSKETCLHTPKHAQESSRHFHSTRVLALYTRARFALLSLYLSLTWPPLQPQCCLYRPHRRLDALPSRELGVVFPREELVYDSSWQILGIVDCLFLSPAALNSGFCTRCRDFLCYDCITTGRIVRTPLKFSEFPGSANCL